MTSLAVAIDYYERNDISVYFDGVKKTTGWGWVGTTDRTINFNPPVPAGVTVRVIRTTDIDAMKHKFASGAQFTASRVDANFQQLVRIAQEYREFPLQGELAPIDFDMGLLVDPFPYNYYDLGSL